MSGESQPRPALRAALDLYAAIRDNRPGDIAALTTPDVLCFPLTRPGRSKYEGHHGMSNLARDIHAAYGNYTITIIEATEHPGPMITIQARLTPQRGHGLPFTVTTTYTFRNDLIATIDSSPDSTHPSP